MAFDEQLSGRVRDALEDVPDLREQRMFGGLAFMIGGHMACGVVGEELMLRLGEDGADAALDEPHVRPMDFTGRPMKTMVFVEPAGTVSSKALRRWLSALSPTSVRSRRRPSAADDTASALTRTPHDRQRRRRGHGLHHHTQLRATRPGCHWRGRGRATALAETSTIAMNRGT